MPFYTTVRARLKHVDMREAMDAHNGVVSRIVDTTKANGGSSHRVFANPEDPRDFLAMDTWDSLEGMQKSYGDPTIQAEIGGLFESPPEVTVWSSREGWTTF
jgi:quinol monooxygenase YgiN